jgi:hypothetical protein
MSKSDKSKKSKKVEENHEIDIKAAPVKPEIITDDVTPVLINNEKIKKTIWAIRSVGPMGFWRCGYHFNYKTDILLNPEELSEEVKKQLKETKWIIIRETEV